jgi:energy-coupling factor transport system permease protein
VYGKLVWEPNPQSSIIHRLDGRTKLIILFALGMCTVLIDSPRSLFILLLATLAGHLAAGSSVERWRILLLFLLLGIWGSMVGQAVFYSQEPRSPILCLLPATAPVIGPLTGGIFIYREGLTYGAVQALRSGIMLSYGFLLCWTSEPRELLRSFTFWRMPYELAFMAVTSLRFLPVIFSETATVLTAQRLRGFEPAKNLSPRRIIQTGFQTLWPVLARSLRRAVTLSMSVESRGFGRARQQSYAPRWPLPEMLVCLVISLAALSIAAMKAAYFLQFNGITYLSGLREVYNFAKDWL